MPNRLLTVHEASDFLQITEPTIYKLLAEGKLIGLRFGGSWRFQTEDLIRFGQRQGTNHTGQWGEHE